MVPLIPPNGARDVCADVALRMRFTGTARVGSTGKLRVFDAGADDAPVASVDFAAQSSSENIGGRAFMLPRPVYVNGDEVIIRLPAQALAYGRRYYITIDQGAITAPDGTPFAISDKTSWQFDTRAAAPSQRTLLHVASDASAEFCSVQGALDALPARNANPATIEIANGTYFEVIHAQAKNNVTLRGENRDATIILGVNNNNLNPSTAARALVGIDNSSDFTIEDLSIHNLTPQGGSQAEALRMQGCDRCTLRRVNVLSLQDTLLWSGRIYARDCYVEGNVDFVWGTGAAFFERCEIKTVGRAGYVVQARNAVDAFGYVFVDSKISAAPGVRGIMLGRIDISQYPGSQVAYINCQMGEHIAPQGWTISGGGPGAALRFGEYRSTDQTGQPLDVKQRIAGSRQLTDDEANAMRAPSNVLGGWTPTP